MQTWPGWVFFSMNQVIRPTLTAYNQAHMIALKEMLSRNKNKLINDDSKPYILKKILKIKRFLLFLANGRA